MRYIILAKRDEGGEFNVGKKRKRAGKHRREGVNDGTTEYTDVDFYSRCSDGPRQNGTYGEGASKLYNRYVIRFRERD